MPLSHLMSCDGGSIAALLHGFDATDSVTVCAFATDPIKAPLIRLPVVPHDQNGLREASSLVVDKVTTVPPSKLGERIGRLADQDMVRLGRAVAVPPSHKEASFSRTPRNVCSCARFGDRRGETRRSYPGCSRARSTGRACRPELLLEVPDMGGRDRFSKWPNPQLGAVFDQDVLIHGLEMQKWKGLDQNLMNTRLFLTVSRNKRRNIAETNPPMTVP